MKTAWWSALNILLFIAILFVGVLFGVTIKNWPIITLKAEVDTVGAMFQIISLGVTLYVAYWVANILEKKKEVNRAEKDLIIKRIDDVYIIIDELNSDLSTQQIPYPLVTSSIKRISVNITSLIEKIKTTAILVEDDHKTNILASLGVIRVLLTETPISSSTNQPADLFVVNDLIQMSETRKLETDLEFDKLKMLVFGLELAVNKS